MKTLFSFIAVLIAAAASGAPLTMGKMPPQGGTTTLSLSGGVITFIDVSHPATTSGVLDRYVLRWRPAVTGDCPAAYAFKVLRPGAIPGTWTVVRALQPVASDVTAVNIAAVGLAVQPGDVLAVTVLKPLVQCGSILLTPDAGSITHVVDGDIPNNATTGKVVIQHGFALNLVAADATRYYGTLPAGGAAAGASNSFFRTALQITNPSSAIMSCRFVFHPAGQSAGAGDPSFDGVFGPLTTTSFPDFVANQLKTSGLGSVDIFAIVPPVITARVYNDGGASGTQGFTEDIVTGDRVMRSPALGTLPYPADPANFRMNIGVRTFDDGATVSFTTYTNNGAQRSTTTKTYGANFFEQFGASSLGANDGWMSVNVTAGSAIVYGSYTDNRTNDSSVRYASAP